MLARAKAVKARVAFFCRPRYRTFVNAPQPLDDLEDVLHAGAHLRLVAVLSSLGFVDLAARDGHAGW